MSRGHQEKITAVTPKLQKIKDKSRSVKRRDKQGISFMDMRLKRYALEKIFVSCRKQIANPQVVA